MRQAFGGRICEGELLDVIAVGRFIPGPNPTAARFLFPKLPAFLFVLLGAAAGFALVAAGRGLAA